MEKEKPRDDEGGWHESAEQLLSKYSDEASIREKLHRAAYYSQKKMFKMLKLPVIVLSALSGSIALLSKSYPGIEGGVITGTAGLSILVSIISAVDTFLSPGNQMSKHEIAKHSWVDLQNLIGHELGLKRSLRVPMEDFLQNIKVRRDRLFEISPVCSKILIEQTKARIKKHAEPAFQIPVYLNGFSGTKIYKEEEWSENSVEHSP